MGCGARKWLAKAVQSGTGHADVPTPTGAVGLLLHHGLRPLFVSESLRPRPFGGFQSVSLPSRSGQDWPDAALSELPGSLKMY